MERITNAWETRENDGFRATGFTFEFSVDTECTNCNWRHAREYLIDGVRCPRCKSIHHIRSLIA